MKSSVNITVEENLLYKAKQFAEKNNISLSQLIEKYFQNLVKPSNPNNIIQLVEQLPKPSFEFEENFKDKYFIDQKGKYGF